MMALRRIHATNSVTSLQIFWAHEKFVKRMVSLSTMLHLEDIYIYNLKVSFSCNQKRYQKRLSQARHYILPFPCRSTTLQFQFSAPLVLAQEENMIYILDSGLPFFVPFHIKPLLRVVTSTIVIPSSSMKMQSMILFLVPWVHA